MKRNRSYSSVAIGPCFVAINVSTFMPDMIENILLKRIIKEVRIACVEVSLTDVEFAHRCVILFVRHYSSLKDKSPKESIAERHIHI